MQIKEVSVGDVFKMTDGGGEYRVVRISGDEIEMEHTRLEAGMNFYLSDLPDMFIGISDEQGIMNALHK